MHICNMMCIYIYIYIYIIQYICNILHIYIYAICNMILPARPYA